MGLQNALINAAQQAINRVNAANTALQTSGPNGTDSGVRIREFQVNNLDDSQSLHLTWNTAANDWIVTG